MNQSEFESASGVEQCSRRGYFFIHRISTLDTEICLWNPVVYMEEKDFDDWNHLKQQLDLRENEKHIREGDIWFCSIGENVGHEQNGKNKYFERPILIVRKFTQDYFWAIPLTSVERTGPLSIKFHFNGI